MPLRVTGRGQGNRGDRRGRRARHPTANGRIERPARNAGETVCRVAGMKFSPTPRNSRTGNWRSPAKNWPRRVVADVFNLVTIGDGVVGGSATLRYSLVNQGVQEFKIRVPAHVQECRVHRPQYPSQGMEVESSRVEGRDEAGHERSWSGQLGCRTRFGAVTPWSSLTIIRMIPHMVDARLPVGGIHTVDIERETGSIAVTTAASLQLRPRTVSDTLRRVDETDCPPPTVRSSPAPSSWPGNTPAVNMTWRWRCNATPPNPCWRRWPTEHKSRRCSPTAAKCSRRLHSW